MNALQERAEYNRLMAAQFDAVRDFVILHYKAIERRGEPFWDHVRTMDIPDTLAAKIALFREKGRLFRYDDDLFSVPSWVAVLIGRHIMPSGYSPLVDSLDDARVVSAILGLRKAYGGDRAVDARPCGLHRSPDRRGWRTFRKNCLSRLLRSAPGAPSTPRLESGK